MKTTPKHVKQAGEALHELHQEAELRRVKQPATSHMERLKREAEAKGLVYLPHPEMGIAQLIRNAADLDKATEYLVGYLCNVYDGYKRSQQGEPAPDAPAYGIIDPDYASIFTKARCIAWTYGYSAVMHGSFTHDLDILLVPWSEHATDDPERIIDMLCTKGGLRKRGEPGIKPHGRMAYTLLFPEFGDPRFVDISIVPKVTPPVQGSGTYTADDIAAAFARAGISDSLFEDVRIELESAK